MYGYANVPKYLGCSLRSSAAGFLPVGISEMEGALDSKRRASCHFAWYFFSIAIRVSRFSVCGLSFRRSSIEVSKKFSHSQALRCFSSWRSDPGDPRPHSLSPYLQLETSLAVLLAKVLQVSERAASEAAYVSHPRLLLENIVTCAGFKRRLLRTFLYRIWFRSPP